MPDPIQSASIAIGNLTKTLTNTKTATNLLDRLESVIPASRSQRAPTVKVSTIRIVTAKLADGSGIPVVVTAKTGDMGQYDTRITFHPKQGFHCTCPDLQQRRAACKHVAALATETRKRFWAIMDLIEADAERMSIRLADLESSVNAMVSQARNVLADSLRALES